MRNDANKRNFNANIIVGVNAVCEALKTKKQIDKILVTENLYSRMKKHIADYNDNDIITVKTVNRKKLDLMFPNLNHQGVVAYLSECKYSNMEDIFELAKNKNEYEFIIIADCIEDPHNLGAIIRSAECMGAHGVIIPERRSSGLTPTVAKASAGAIEHIPIVKVKNLSRTVDELKEKGMWIYCTDMNGQSVYETKFDKKVAIVIGNEGHGVSRIIKEKSDFTVSIPLFGEIESLNASVAAGIVMSVCSRQRYKFGEEVKA